MSHLPAPRLILAATVWAASLFAFMPAAGADTGLADANPDRPAFAANDYYAPGGRTAGIAVDPRDGNHAWALAEAGGLFVTRDGGSHWESNVRADGSPGAYGHGLEKTGLTQFQAIAVDPFDSQHVVLLANDDNRVATQQGVWTSTDGGANWSHPATGSPPCSINGQPASLKIAFAPDVRDLVFATTTCRVGRSTDGGKTWTWLSPVDTQPDATIEGLDVQRSGSGAAVAAMCVNTAPRRSIVFLPSAAGKGLGYPSPPTDTGGYCDVALDPGDPTHVFVGTAGGGAAGISEGRRSVSDVSWTDLHAPQIGDSDKNGRPALVQTHPDGAGAFQLYYHDSTALYTTHCTTANGCTPGPPRVKSDSCPGAGDPWQCVDVFHTDSTDIAFDPAVPTSCPLYVAGDGGVTRESDCGHLAPGANPPGPGALPANVGLHAIEPYESAFDGETAILPLQDNGVIVRAAGGVWHRELCGDGFHADALDNVGYWHCNGGYRHVPDVGGYPAGSFDFASPPGAFDMWYGWRGRFVNPDELVVPTLDAGNHLLMRRFDPAAKAWESFGKATDTAVGPFAGGQGDMAVANRRGTVPSFRDIYVITPRRGTRAKHELWCWAPGGTWTRAKGLNDPLRVWASDGNPFDVYVFDAVNGITRAHSKYCSFAADAKANELATGAGTFRAKGDVNAFVAHADIPVTAVDFDPGRPGRVAVGTQHAGILLTEDYGASWHVTHRYPEPNGGVVGFNFSDSGLAGGTIERTTVASWGRGIWEVALRPPARVVWAGLPRGYVALKGRIALVTVRCPPAAPAGGCAGRVALRAMAGRRLTLLGSAAVHLRKGHTQLIRVRLRRGTRARRAEVVVTLRRHVKTTRVSRDVRLRRRQAVGRAAIPRVGPAHFG